MSGLRLRRRRDEVAALRAERDAYRAALTEVARVCELAARGDLEERVRHFEGEELVTELAAALAGLNRLLDLTDAFVREASASLSAAAHGRFHRRFLVRGMRGSFRDGAVTIDGARTTMEDGAARLEQLHTERRALADQFQDVVLELCARVASTATETSRSTEHLTAYAHTASEEARAAHGAVARLDTSSTQIQDVVRLINSVADQTKLLALNATIEAARAGEAGKGFAVVASEVKDLADQTARATDDILAQVQTLQAASAEAGRVLNGIVESIREMQQQIEAIGSAVAGSASVAGPATETVDGLAQMADVLRAEMATFLDALRR